MLRGEKVRGWGKGREIKYLPNNRLQHFIKSSAFMGDFLNEMKSVEATISQNEKIFLLLIL